MRTEFILLILGLWLQVVDAAGNLTGVWGGQGDGTYRNPIVAGDYSDPDVLEVNGTYYLISSTFQYSPGIVILKSKDLLYWETAGYVVDNLNSISSEYNWDRMSRSGNGIYAPSLRYYDGIFWVFFTCYGDGFYLAKSPNILGPYTIDKMVDMNGKDLTIYNRWDDPCPVWLSTGEAYLVASKPGGGWYPYVFQMSPDGMQLLDGDVVNMTKPDYQEYGHGTAIWDVWSAEANKIYFWNDTYYFYSNPLNADKSSREPWLLRSKNVYGTHPDGTPGSPQNKGSYEVQRVMSNKPSDLDPAQGTFIEGPKDNWWFLTQNGVMSQGGRPLSLVPVNWQDGWPFAGQLDEDDDGIPEFSWDGWTVPAIRSDEKDAVREVYPQGSDDFSGSKLKLQWQWHFEPRQEYWSLSEREGFMRLRPFAQLIKDNFFRTGNILLQRWMRSKTATATTRIEISGWRDGMTGGMAWFGLESFWSAVTIVQEDSHRYLRHMHNGNVMQEMVLTCSQRDVIIRSHVTFDGLLEYQVSLDNGRTFVIFGNGTELSVSTGLYRGAAVGLFTHNNQQEEGYMDIDWFDYDFSDHRG